LNKREPQPAIAEPVCPEWLSAEAKAVWQDVAPELLRLKLLSIVDGGALAAYCEAVAEFGWATRTLAKEGRVIRMKKSGYRLPHPCVAMQRSAWQGIRSFAALFGLDPADRSRLQVPGEPGKEVDEFEQFLRSGSTLN
jgi:P27 family predicted phage terminase small subunit